MSVKKERKGIMTKRLLTMGCVLGLVTTGWAWPPQPSVWKFTPSVVTLNTCGWPVTYPLPVFGARIDTQQLGGGEGVCPGYPPGAPPLTCFPYAPIKRDFHQQNAWELWSAVNQWWGTGTVKGYHDRWNTAYDWAAYIEAYVPPYGTGACQMWYAGTWVRQ